MPRNPDQDHLADNHNAAPPARRSRIGAKLVTCALLAVGGWALFLFSGQASNADTAKPAAKAVEPAEDGGAKQSTASKSKKHRAFSGEMTGDTRDDNELKLELVWCGPGTFTMGSPSEETVYRQNERQVEVTLTHGFWIGKYEVTQAEWQRLMESNPSEFALTGASTYRVRGVDTSRLPVECILAEEAYDFCRKLTEREQSEGRLPKDWTYTMPTEAQWEYACRAGATTATVVGDKISSLDANFRGFVPYNGGARGPFLMRTATVGSYPANAWGIHDMHGNVWEFCAGWYIDESRGGRDPTPTTSGEYRIGKGGSWFHDGRMCRSAFRYWIEPEMRQGTVGFRVVATPMK